MRRRRIRGMELRTGVRQKEDLEEEGLEGSTKEGIRCQWLHSMAANLEARSGQVKEEVSERRKEEALEANMKADIKLHLAYPLDGLIQVRRCHRDRIGVIKWRLCRVTR
jgi:hypothetical protein